MRKELKSLDNYQLVIPEVMVETLHQLYHDSPMAGHVGIHETLYRMSEHCLFKRMVFDFNFWCLKSLSAIFLLYHSDQF